MTTRRFTQQYGYIALLLALAFVCAIPLLYAHPESDDWNNENQTSGWAWVGGHSISVQNGNVVSRSEHQCGIHNKSTKTISISVTYDHKLQENGSVVAEDTYNSAIAGDAYDVDPGQYFTTSDVNANYVRSASTGHNSEASYKFQPYTYISYRGQAQARAQHIAIPLE